MFKIVSLKNSFEFIALGTSMCTKKYDIYSGSGVFPLLALQKVHIGMPHSQPINYIVYSVREKTCTVTAQDRFVYFSDYY